MEKKLSENSDKDEENNAGDTPHHASSSEPGNPDDAIAKHDDHAKADSAAEGEATDEVSKCPLTLGKLSADVDSWIVETMLHQKADITEIPDCVDKFLDLVEENIVTYDAGEGRPKWGEVPEQDSSFLESVNRITKLSKVLSQSQCSSQHINERRDSLANRIGVMRQGAMSYLEEVFRMLMEEYRNQYKGEYELSGYDPKGEQVEHDSSAPPDSEHSDFPGYSEETITSLNRIAGEMISSGYESECCQVYIISRRNAFEERLHKLGFEKISIDDIQKLPWESLEKEIPTWITTFKECACSYFPGELKLVESVFKEHPSIGAGLYSNLTRGVVILLLNFAEGVAMTKRSAEKLFKFLDMCETLGLVISALNRLLTDERGGELKAETASARNRLGEAAISIFCDLENSIKAEAGKTAVPGGAVHPLTRYVMNYLPYACEYKDTLEQVFKEHAKLQGAASASGSHHQHQENDRGEGKEESPFADQVMRVMELLDASLEGKAKLYKDVSLGCIFMMNNGRYILQKIKGSSEIYQLLGNTWCRKKSSDLRAQHKNYQRESWSKILRCLNPEGLTVSGKVQKPLLKERFKSFNAMFDEIQKTQSSWIVNDEQLQSELRVSIAGLVIPAYRAFVGRFSQNLTAGRQTEKYIKYQPEDIEAHIENLFAGNPQFMSKRKLV
ncbi:exocyst complex component EXO70B1-like [Neltuma alba]|uniref:exocyst complex component EXO70B1-like n=1 Tax=Neltuma alba TaxID=207710 RepID=UPI0010A3E4EF|nr:exocyst complex component EXO70B1-like [Prosopis alba]